MGDFVAGVEPPPSRSTFELGLERARFGGDPRGAATNARSKFEASMGRAFVGYPQHESDDGPDDLAFLCGACEAPLPWGADACAVCDTPVAPPEQVARPWAGTASSTPAAETAPSAPAPVAAPTTDVDATEVDPEDDLIVQSLVREALRRDAEIRRAQVEALPPAPVAELPDAPSAEAPRRQRQGLVAVAAVVVLLFAAGFVIARHGNSASVDATAPTTVASSAAPFAPTTVKAKAFPTTIPKAKNGSPTTAAGPATTAVPAPAAGNASPDFCAAAAEYSVTDVLVLAQHVVADPDAFDASYTAMLTHAPSEIAIPLRTLGPLTHTGADLVRKGTITTPEQLRDWLSTTAPPEQVAEWIGAQQKIAPVVQQRCP